MRKTGEPRRGRAVGRRAVLKAAGIGIAAGAFPTILTPRKTRAATTITVRDPGGTYSMAFNEAFYKPFTAATGIEIVGVAGQHEPTAQIKAMVDTKAYTWDVALLSLSAHNVLRDAGYLEPLELDDDPVIQEIPARFRTPYLVGDEVYATILGYRTDKYGTNAPVGGWKDVWDVERLPGRRGLRKHSFDTVEQALMADGVPPDQVYPCDLARAFKSLDKIKPNVDIWWSGGAQTTQLLSTGELDICTTWNGRAQAAIDSGAPVAISWMQGLYTNSGWCILKGDPKADACREFIKFASRADRQAAYTPHLAIGPTNPNAYKHIDAERAKVLPTSPANLEQMIQIDAEYWGEHKDKALEQFMAWLLK